LLVGLEARAVVFNDGQFHVVDANNSFPGELVILGPTSGTAVQIIEGGEVGGLEAYGGSYVSVAGGSAPLLVSFDQASVDISGGDVGRLETYGSTYIQVSGGSVGPLLVFDTSFAIVYEAAIGSVEAHNSSNVIFSATCGRIALFDRSFLYLDGIITASESEVHDQARLSFIFGGLIENVLRASGNSQVSMSDGRVGAIALEGTDPAMPRLEMTGGELRQEAAMGSQGGLSISKGEAVISGSTIYNLSLRKGVGSSLVPAVRMTGGVVTSSVWASAGVLALSDVEIVGADAGTFCVGDCAGGLHSPNAHILGGTIRTDLAGDMTGEVFIQGGVFEGPMRATDDSRIFVYGSSFNYPLGEIPDLSGTVTGILATGDLLDVPFERDLDATITLPEPGALLMLASGIGTLMVLRRTRGR
jgi:hypothetical protein